MEVSVVDKKSSAEWLNVSTYRITTILYEVVGGFTVKVSVVDKKSSFVRFVRSFVRSFVRLFVRSFAPNVRSSKFAQTSNGRKERNALSTVDCRSTDSRTMVGRWSMVGRRDGRRDGRIGRTVGMRSAAMYNTAKRTNEGRKKAGKGRKEGNAKNRRERVRSVFGAC